VNKQVISELTEKSPVNEHAYSRSRIKEFKTTDSPKGLNVRWNSELDYWLKVSIRSSQNF
jgi:hypothetical protein